MAAPPKLNEFHIHPQNILFRSSVIRIRARNWKNDVKDILLDISDPGSSKMTGTNLDNFILLSNFVTKRWRGNIVEGPGSAEVIYKLYQSKNLSSKWWQSQKGHWFSFFSFVPDYKWWWAVSAGWWLPIGTPGPGPESFIILPTDILPSHPCHPPFTKTHLLILLKWCSDRAYF